MDTPNLLQMPIPPDAIAGFVSGDANLSELLALSELIVKVKEVPPGNHLCPFHYEYVEEWLVVLTGIVDVRTPEGTRRLGAGDVAAFPIGPAGAHQVTVPADADAPSRLLMFSADADPAVVVYPDGDKLAVYTHSGEDEVFVRRGAASSHLEYYDGESA